MPFRTILVFLFLSFWLVAPLSGLAQSNDYIEDNSESLWQQDQFVDPATSLEEPLEDNSTEYIGEDEAAALGPQVDSQQKKSIDMAAALEKDAKLMPDNLKWGALTGVVLGAWIALNSSTDARDNARYIGSGAVFGALLGMTVGAKSIYQSQLGVPQKSGWAISPMLDPSTNSLATKVEFRSSF